MNIKIGSKIISPRSPVFIIAEAGVNHDGRLDLALKLIEAAAEAGADAVKFQTFKAEQVTTPQNRMAEYQQHNLGQTKPQIEMIRQLEMPNHWYPKLIKRCQELGILFMSAPHGHVESANLLKRFKLPAYKIASGDLTNRPLLEHVARFGKPIIVSTGMATMLEVKETVGWIKGAGNRQIILLHCTTNYPCPPEEVNLSAMSAMQKEWPALLMGYSDHTSGSQAAIMAVTLGARVIEKHLTLDKKMPGPDHLASSTPEEFKEMTKAIRHTPVILGTASKKPNASENKISQLTRKSIATAIAIKKGEKFTAANLTIKRPGYGILPKHYKSILGKKAKRDLPGDILLTKKDF